MATRTARRSQRRQAPQRSRRKPSRSKRAVRTKKPSGQRRGRGERSVRVAAPGGRGMIQRGVRALSGLISSIAPASAFSDLEGTVSNDRLLRFLGEMLAVEQGAVQLYTAAIEHATDAEIRNQLDSFLAQARRHVDLTENAIRELGGNPAEPSPEAGVQQEQLNGMLRLEPAPGTRETLDLENLVWIELKERYGWELAREMLPFIEAPHAHDVCERILDEVEDEEDEHLSWCRRTLSWLKIRELVQPGEQRQVA